MRAEGARSEKQAKRGVILERSDEDLRAMTHPFEVPFASSLRSAARG
jgi:hypothetical protein